MVLLILQGLEDLDGEPSYKALAHTLEVVVLNEFVKVYA